MIDLTHLHTISAEIVDVEPSRVVARIGDRVAICGAAVAYGLRHDVEIHDDETLVIYAERRGDA